MFQSYIGLVAQWTRARGYEPRCREFESLLAQELTTFFSIGIRIICINKE